MTIALVVGVGSLVVALLPDNNLNKAVDAADRFRAAVVAERWSEACDMTTKDLRRQIRKARGQTCEKVARRTAKRGTRLHAALECRSFHDIIYSRQQTPGVDDRLTVPYGSCKRDQPEAGTLGVRRSGDHWLVFSFDPWSSRSS